jgi:hypothetical protein
MTDIHDIPDHDDRGRAQLVMLRIGCDARERGDDDALVGRGRGNDDRCRRARR